MEKQHAINAYPVVRVRDNSLIKKLLKQGYEVVYSKTDHYVVINGKTFNGYSKEDIENLRKEL